MKEYEAISNKDGRESNLDFDFVRSPDLLSVDVGGQNINAIQEKDGNQEEQSMETVKIEESANVSKNRRSPGRLFKATGVED